MFFSVVIPTYNRSAFIKETIESVLNQTYSQFEILVIDDGSTDKTGEVIKTISDSRLKYFYTNNGERGRARNYGFKQAKGDYVIFFDSDDIMLPDHLEVLKSKILFTNFPNFIATKFNFNRNGEISDSDLVTIKEDFYNIGLFLHGNVLACNFCIKKDNPRLKLFEENRAFAILEDWMFLLQNLELDKIYIVDKVTITMSDHDERSMRADSKKLNAKFLLLVDWAKNNLSLTKVQFDLLFGHIYYLCAIHAYTDNHRAEALKFIYKANKCIPFNKKLSVLLLKSLFGVDFISKIKRLKIKGQN